MADLNDPLKESYIGKVADALGPCTADLKDKGFDPASRMPPAWRRCQPGA